MYQSLLLAGVITVVILWLTVIKIFAKGKVKNLQTQYVLITGCDTGFGRETAVRLDNMGVHVLATCLTEEGVRRIKEMASDRLKAFVMDVTDIRQIKDVFEQVKKFIPPEQGMKTWNYYAMQGHFGPPHLHAMCVSRVLATLC